MKIFVSMPMAGKTREEIAEEFEIAKTQVKSVAVITDSVKFKHGYFTEKQLKGNSELRGFAESIWIMSKCDAVYFAEGWQDTRGCRLEYEICKKYGMRILN